MIQGACRRVEAGEFGGDGQDLLRRHARAGEEMRIDAGMVCMVCMIVRVGDLLRFRADGAVGDECRAAAGTVDDGQAGMGSLQRGAEKFLEAATVDDQDLGPPQFLHLLRRQGIVVGAAEAGREKELDDDTARSRGDVAGHLIDGKGRGEDLSRRCGARGRDGEERGQEADQGEAGDAVHGLLLDGIWCRRKEAYRAGGATVNRIFEENRGYSFASRARW